MNTNSNYTSLIENATVCRPQCAEGAFRDSQTV